MRMRAFRLAQVDKENDMHMQAWLHQMVKQTKNVGTDKKPKQEPVFKKYKDFFDYEKRLREVEKPKEKTVTTKQKYMARIAARVNRGEVG